MGARGELRVRNEMSKTFSHGAHAHISIFFGQKPDVFPPTSIAPPCLHYFILAVAGMLIYIKDVALQHTDVYVIDYWASLSVNKTVFSVLR